MAGETATAANGTHPTEIHSCLQMFCINVDMMLLMAQSD